MSPNTQQARAQVQAEEDVLAARRPSGIEDDWPVFDLANATVTSPDGKLASLLLAGEKNALRLTGQLQASSIDDARMWRASGKPRNTPIEIAQVFTYSYGTFDADGSVGLWASGKAGWYLIKPSAKYRRVYDEMVEGVQLLFFIVDAYQTTRKAGRGKNATLLPEYSAQEVFEKYAVEVIGIEKAAPEAAQKMYKHRDFLLASMLARKEGVFWSKTPLYKHLCRKFPADVARIKKNLAEQPPRAKTEDLPAPQQHMRQASSDSASTTSSLKRKRGRPPKNAPDVISIASSSVADEAAAPTKPVAVDISKSKSKSKPPTSQPHRALTARRKKSNSTPEIQDSQSATPAAQESDSDARPANRRKSALRLKPNKPSKGPPKPASKEDEIEDDDEEDELAGPEPAARNGSKRRREEPEIRTAPTAKPSYRNTRRHKLRPDSPHSIEPATEPETTLDEGIDIPASPSPSASAGAASSETLSHPAQLAHRPSPHSQEVWHCALDGCNHCVYGPCSAPETQALIREHYALHAYDDDERVRMVRMMAEPSLPVERLVERVKGRVGLERMEGTRVGGSRFPEPVKMKT